MCSDSGGICIPDFKKIPKIFFDFLRPKKYNDLISTEMRGAQK